MHSKKWFYNLKHNLNLFWDLNPFLLFGLTSVLGFSSIFFKTIELVIPMILILITSRKKQSLLALFVFLTACFYSHTNFHTKKERIEGRALINILSKKTSNFGCFYKGKIKILNQNNDVNTKTIIFSYSSKNIIEPGIYEGKVIVNPKQNTYQASEITLTKCIKQYKKYPSKAKNLLKKYIRKNFTNKNCASLCEAFILGDITDKYIKEDFKKLGLSHLIVVSGFHFIVLLVSIQIILKHFNKVARFCVETLVCISYCYFLVDGPSVLRAALSVIIGSLFKLFIRNSSPINILGLVLFLMSWLSPEICLSIGFHLSFLATGTIFLIPVIIEKPMNLLFPIPNKEKIKSNFKKIKILIFVINYLKQSLSITLAMSLIMGPLILYLFHEFTLNSLFYNLFIPQLVSITIFLFIIGIFIPYVNAINTIVLSFILKIIEQKKFMFISLYDNNLKSWMVTSYISLLFLIGIFLLQSKKVKRQRKIYNSIDYKHSGIILQNTKN